MRKISTDDRNAYQLWHPKFSITDKAIPQKLEDCQNRSFSTVT